jgi:hypothetical protein
MLLALCEQSINNRQVNAEKNMQDKFAIGPVTIVQLVGLNSKPRISSAKSDATARAADQAPPQSAHVGIADDLQNSVGEVGVSYFDINTPQSLSLTAAPLRPNISVEGGVDRAAPDGGEPQTAVSTSPFDNLSGNFDIAALVAALRAGSTSPTSVSPDPVSPDPASPTAPTSAATNDPPPTGDSAASGASGATTSGIAGSGAVDTQAPAVVTFSGEAAGGEAAGGEAGAKGDAGFDFIFDGASGFGDDKILDFEQYYHDAGLLIGSSIFAENEIEVAMAIEIQEFDASHPSALDGAHMQDLLLDEILPFNPNELANSQNPAMTDYSLLPN